MTKLITRKHSKRVPVKLMFIYQQSVYISTAIVARLSVGGG